MEATLGGWRAGHRNQLIRRGGAVLAAVTLIAASLVLASTGDATASPATPLATITAPTTGFLGEGFSLNVTFDNTDSTDPGYGPYLDVSIPNAGEDGAGPAVDDGLTSGSPTYLGSPVATTTIACTGAPVVHPLTGLSVACPAGTSLLIVELPFGSFTPGQPPAVVTIPISVSPLADLGFGLAIQATAGFRFGANPLDDPVTDPPIVQSPPTAHTYTPNQVFDMRKVYLGPEDETATGPNFPRQYRLEARVAEGQTITNLSLLDDLPNNLAYLQTDATAPGGAAVVDEPTVGAAANPPDNVLQATWPSVTESGSPGAYDDASLLFSFFVPRVDADGNPVNPVANGDDVTAANQARATGDWLPIDPRDQGGGPIPVAIDAPGPEHVLTPKSIATQKSVALTDDPTGNGTSPGDTLTWTVAFQISDFFTFDQTVVHDLLGDGQTYVNGSAALTVTDEGTTEAGTFPSGQLNVDTSARTACGGGTTALTFDVSSAMTELTGGTDNGVIAGGFAQNPVGNAGAATGSITFETTVSQSYACSPPADRSVDERDTVANTVSIDGRILDNATRAPTGFTEADTSAASTSIAQGNIVKTLYARNGTLCTATPMACSSFQVGDEITWQLERSLPTSDFEDLALVDFLPLPVLPVPGSLSFDATPADPADPPGANAAQYGPGDTFHAISGAPAPTISTDATDNSVTFDYGSFDTDPDQSASMNVLFTLTISDQPFADKLQLTNQLFERSQNSFGSQTTANTLHQMTLTAPDVQVRKGVVASDAAAPTFSPGTVGPVAFSAPGTAGTRFAGTISSNGLDATPINSNLAGIEAGDRVTFAVVAQNRGSAPNGAFDVRLRDTLPTGFAIPSGGLNLRVTNGTGASLSTSPVNGSDPEPLFGSGIELDDPSSAQGSLAAYDAAAGPPVNTTSGLNVVVATYDLVAAAVPAADALLPGQVLTNTARLFHFAATNGGTNFVTADRSDDATVTALRPTVTKIIVGTSAGHTTGNDVAIGEQVTYEVTITVPQGRSPAVSLVDTLDNGLAFVTFDSITASSGLSRSAGSFQDVLDNVAVTNTGRTATFDFGDIDNAAADADAEMITLRYTVAVRNVVANQNGGQRNNAATWSWDDGGGAPAGSVAGSAPNVTIREPALTVTKVSSPTSADAGDTVQYTVTVANPSASPVNAFEATLADDVPAGLTYVPGSFTHVSGLAPTTGPDDGGAPTLTAGWDTFPRLSTSTFTYDAVVSNSASANDTFVNTAKVRWTSLPGSPASQSPYVDDDVERTGADGPGGALNDYGINAQKTLRITNPAIQKAFVDSSEPSTTGQSLTVGETANYDIVVALPEGQVPGATVVDRIPAGMQYVGGSAAVITDASQSVNLSHDFAGSLTSPAISGGAGNGDDLTVAFPATIAVDPDNDATNNSFVVRLTLRVLDAGTNHGIAPGQTLLTNDATVRVGTGPTVTSNGIGSNVVEPSMHITKAVAPTSALGGDQVTVTLAVTNNGTSTSFDTNVDDPLDGNFDETSASNQTTSCGFLYSRTGDTVHYSGGTVAVGAVCNLEFTVNVDTGLAAATVVPNTATVSQATTLPGSDPGERDEPDTSGSANLNIITPDLVVTKTDGVTATTPGATLTYTITVRNVGGATAPDAQLTDTLPPNTSLVGCSDACGNPSADTVSWSLGDIDLVTVLTRTVTVVVDDPVPAGVTTIANTAEASDSGVNGPDPTPANNSAIDTDTVTATPEIGITKSDGQTSVVPGQQLTYTLTITNSGDQAATGTFVTDTIPVGTTFVSCSDACDSTALPAVSWPTFALAGGGASVTRTITVTVDTPAAAGVEQIVNSAAVVDDGANGTDPDTSNNLSSDTDDVAAAPDLAVVKTDGLERLEGGDAATYVVTVGNVGTEDDSGVVVTDALPAGVTFSSCTAGCVTNGPPISAVTWNIGNLGAGASRQLHVTVTVDGPVLAGTTQFLNAVQVTDTDPEPDPTPGDNSASDADTFGADLSVTKTDNSTTATPGAPISYAVVVTNGGPSVVSDLILTDTLPQALTSVSFNPSAGTFDPSSGAWSGLALAPGDAVTLTVSGTVDPAATGSLINDVAVALPTGFTDPTPGNNTASDVDQLVPESDLTMTKTAVGAFVAGGTATYEITVTNRGPSVAADAKVVDTMPAGLEPTSASGTAWTCTITGQVVECTDGTPIAPGTTTSLHLQARITAPAGTSLQNSATVTGALGVSAATAVASAAVTTATSGPLAMTGRNLLNLTALGAALCALGAVLVLVGRRRGRVPSR